MSAEVQKNLEVIGATLRDARLRAFLTQSEVGQRAGVSRQLVSRIEQGCNGEISAYLAVAIALHQQVVIVQDPEYKDDEPAGLDFTDAPPVRLD